MSAGAENVRVRVVVSFVYELPTVEGERLAIYGTNDTVKCVQIDLDNDPMAVIADAEDLEIVEAADV